MARELCIEIPGRGQVCLRHLVLDYNGTIADRGELQPGARECIARLCECLDVHVITADTYGTVRATLNAALGPELEAGRLCVDILPPKAERPGVDEGGAKLALLKALGAEHCCALGNGKNDVPMLEAAALAICVLGPEGCYPGAMTSADIVVTSAQAGLQLLLEPSCIVATLRN